MLRTSRTSRTDLRSSAELRVGNPADFSAPKYTAPAHAPQCQQWGLATPASKTRPGLYYDRPEGSKTNLGGASATEIKPRPSLRGRGNVGEQPRTPSRLIRC